MTLLRCSLAAVAIVSLALPLDASQKDGAGPKGIPGVWSLDWSDEFSGTQVDLGPWNVAGHAPSGAINCYDSNQARVSGGLLHLILEHRTDTCADGSQTRPYVSGSVSAKKTFTAGAFEARVNVPAAPGGLIANFPAFWLVAWPAVGEIDIWEGLAESGSCWSVHPQPNDQEPAGCAAPTTGWHTFGAEWTAGKRVDVYYDGRMVGSMPWTGGAAQYPVLDNAVADWSSIIVPADLQVDYVRHWIK
ncbi:glycoside hydrolase family 16 protein [Kitasatospora sp. DSM 101779]|uniref:glycoside hydrolase family 16 protein n=1 Tax=Kitasatospora sp. DSM 101779 TaxID=2853165 RepID=UPI0021D87EEB|nr:glycoside hydrolase family 16 protein [Kitasatospora sp. DSM 101779]MCU7827062.1 glycoside hydrolase family 16 protein [Kitasatospora sp. DSM 101779]